MRFGTLSLDEAEGAILAHSLKLGGLAFKKGRRLSASDVAALRTAGVADVVAAKLEDGDVAEDEAADRIAAAIAGPGLSRGAAFTGRVNLFAAARGLLWVDVDRLDRLNLLNEAVTVATLPAYAPLEARQMAATVKIIPFAAPSKAVEAVERMVAEGGPLVALRPFRGRRVGLVQTRLPGMKDSVLDKTVEATRERLVTVEGTLLPDRRTAHTAAEVAAAVEALRDEGAGLILVAGASAIADRRDVLPAGIEQAGGRVEHFGMPVDPGNLLLVARLGEVPVLGLPGCARSPKLNGFDWVLQRLMADVPVTRADIMRMGVGGLLAEIPSRPLPRAQASPGPAPAHTGAPRVAALVLAAGRSTRMGGPNKLLVEVEGQPMLVHAVDAALRSQAAPVVVVTGHQGDDVASALAGRDVTLVPNPEFAAGLSSSLRAGLARVPAEADAVIVQLGDMPKVGPDLLNRLIAAYNPTEGRAICVPTVEGKRGNPVLWDRRFFLEMAAVEGDVGARHLIGAHADLVCEVPVDGDAPLVDLDTPEALAAFHAAGEPAG
ncbi:MAG TPA: molybdopterin-binding/glycosyltransferase family 2 protein [Azospirillaceae bacterium]|nr:molybdopterin-binding/glycosyltransferase family 2 protein [Azospirillaceae bacterium]